MKHFHHTALVNAPRERLYRIITDIENYPSIINQCSEAKVSSRTPQPDGSETVVGTLKIQIGPLNRSFTTSNIHLPCSKVVVHLQSGSMQSLQGEWRLAEASADTTRIWCDFTYSLGNNMLDNIVSRFLDSYLRDSIQDYIACAERYC